MKISTGDRVAVYGYIADRAYAHGCRGVDVYIEQSNPELIANVTTCANRCKAEI